jgi:hypothetical protein
LASLLVTGKASVALVERKVLLALVVFVVEILMHLSFRRL